MTQNSPKTCVAMGVKFWKKWTNAATNRVKSVPCFDWRTQYQVVELTILFLDLIDDR